MEKRPTFQEKVLAVFQGKNTNNIPWQPRLEHWFNVNRARNQLVEPYQSMKLLDLYKNLNCSVRYYYGEAQDISSPNTFIHFDYPPDAGVFEIQQGDDIKVIFRSAKGEELIGKKRLGEWGCSWHYVEHPVKNIEDLRILEDIVTSVRYRFDKDFYLEAKKAVGEWGEIQFYWERSPFQRIFFQLPWERRLLLFSLLFFLLMDMLAYNSQEKSYSSTFSCLANYFRLRPSLFLSIES